MNCTYRKHGHYPIYYKIIDNKILCSIYSNRTVIRITDNDDFLALANNTVVTDEITKEEFDIVMNDAILKMIEISII
jgi:hypothetical protein